MYLWLSQPKLGIIARYQDGMGIIWGHSRPDLTILGLSKLELRLDKMPLKMRKQRLENVILGVIFYVRGLTWQMSYPLKAENLLNEKKWSYQGRGPNLAHNLDLKQDENEKKMTIPKNHQTSWETGQNLGAKNGSRKKSPECEHPPP